jgi:membrane protease subunit HflK
MDQFRPRQERNPVEEIQKGVQDVKALVDKIVKGWGVWLLIVLVLLVYLSSGFFIVGPGEKGVVLLFGKVSSVVEPGLRYRLPKPFMSHVVVDIQKVRRAEVGFRTDGGRTRSVPAESLMLTGDENIVDVQLFVQYMVQDPIKFLFGAQSPENVLKVSAEVALRGVVGENTIDYTMTTGRMEIQKKVELNLQKLLDYYNTGLLITQARLLVVDPPAQVQEAFHDVVRAWEDRERLIKEAEGFREDIVPKARGQAQQEIRQAEAYKAQRVIRARGDAEQFINILEAYTKAPVVTRERLYLESAEVFLKPTKKYLMQGDDSRVLPLLPLSGVTEDRRGTSQSSFNGARDKSEPKNK